MTIQIRHNGDVTVLYCRGRITFQREAAAVYDRVAEFLRRRQPVLLNLAGVDAIDACGLGSLVGLQMLAQDLDCAIKFSNLTGGVLKLIQLTHLSALLEVYGTESEALAAFREHYGAAHSSPRYDAASR